MPRIIRLVEDLAWLHGLACRVEIGERATYARFRIAKVGGGFLSKEWSWNKEYIKEARDWKGIVEADIKMIAKEFTEAK